MKLPWLHREQTSRTSLRAEDLAISIYTPAIEGATSDVVITHIPTGLRVHAQGKSVLRCKEDCINQLTEKIFNG